MLNARQRFPPRGLPRKGGTKEQGLDQKMSVRDEQTKNEFHTACLGWGQESRKRKQIPETDLRTKGKPEGEA